MKSEKGQAMVEFAVVIIVLLLIVLGVVEFARIGHAYLVTAHASREGARVGALQHSDTDILNAVWDASTSLDAQYLEVTILPMASARQRGESVTVLVSYEISMITPLGNLLPLPNPFLVESQTIMRVE